jgi:hypothetical protein
VDEEVADETPGCANGGPSTTTGGIVVIVAFPGELGAGRSVARAVANIEEAFEGTEGDLAVRAALEADVGLLDKVEEVIIPGIHLDDPPTASEGFGEGRDLGHQRTSASRAGNRTRL